MWTRSVGSTALKAPTCREMPPAPYPTIHYRLPCQVIFAFPEFATLIGPNAPQKTIRNVISASEPKSLDNYGQ